VGKGLIVALNKWDIMQPESKTFDNMVKELKYKNPDLEGVPFLSTSGLTGKRLVRVLDEIIKVKANVGRILGRDNVIQFFEETVAKHPHPSTSAGPVILTRCCQVLVNPPALAFEVNHPERIQVSYTRYLRRQAFEFFKLDGAPLRVWFRSRFKLRTDEELEKYLAWGTVPIEVKEEWLENEPDRTDEEFVSDISDEEDSEADDHDPEETGFAGKESERISG
jgi:GTP-binding protein